MVVGLDGFAQLLSDLIRNLPGILAPAEHGQQHHELIASDARHRISATHSFGYTPGDFLENRIPGGVTIRIVDLFEAVEVQVEHS